MIIWFNLTFSKAVLTNIRKRFLQLLRHDFRPFNKLHSKGLTLVIHSKGSTLSFADKTSNLYKIKKEHYYKMLKDSITTTYKKASDNIHNKIKTDRTHEGQRYAK